LPDWSAVREKIACFFLLKQENPARGFRRSAAGAGLQKPS
jgi:hypothetical protein